MASLLSVLKKEVSFSGKRVVAGRIRTRLTPSGWGFLLLILCGFLMSVNFSNNLVFAMTFLLVAIASVGWYHTRSNVARLKTGRWRGGVVFAGGKVDYRMQVTNPSRYCRYGIQVAAAGGIGSDEVQLEPGAQVGLSLLRPAEQRGVLPSAAAWLSSSFPLGLFVTKKMTVMLPEVLVYPAPKGEQPLPESIGNSSATCFREAESFTEMRRYSPGDPLSRVSWRAYARTDELYTNEFDGARGQAALWLRWEDVRVMETEAKLSQLCRWVLDAHAAGRDYGLAIPGTTLEPAKEERHFHRCLTALAYLGGKGE